MKRVARNLTVHDRHRLATTERVSGDTSVVRGDIGRRHECRVRHALDTMIENGRTLWVSLLLIAIAFSPGCNVFYLAKRTLKYEPRDYDLTLDEAAACKQYAIWAEEAWGMYLDTAPEAAISPDFERGFRDGFVDFVFAGGSGNAPLIPPRRFWRTMYRNPEGDQSINEWTGGFRAGSDVARNGGYRKRAIVPALGQRREVNDLPPPQLAPWESHLTKDSNSILNAPVLEGDPDGDIPDGEAPDGEAPDGEAPDGEAAESNGLFEPPVEEDAGAKVDSESESGADSDDTDKSSPSYRETPDLRRPTGDIPSSDTPIDRSPVDDPSDDSDATSNPFMDDPLDDNPFDKLPGIDELEKTPNKAPAMQPSEELFEDLFGEPADTPEKEAYRRQAIPSDRVLQNQNVKPFADRPFEDIAAQVQATLAETQRDLDQSQQNEQSQQIAQAQRNRQSQHLAAVPPNRLPAEPATSQTVPTTSAADNSTLAKQVVKQASKAILADDPTTADSQPLRNHFESSAAQPLTRADWFIEGVNGANSKQRPNLPGLPGTTETGRMTGQLADASHPTATIDSDAGTPVQTLNRDPVALAAPHSTPVAETLTIAPQYRTPVASESSDRPQTTFLSASLERDSLDFENLIDTVGYNTVGYNTVGYDAAGYDTGPTAAFDNEDAMVENVTVEDAMVSAAQVDSILGQLADDLNGNTIKSLDKVSINKSDREVSTAIIADIASQTIGPPQSKTTRDIQQAASNELKPPPIQQPTRTRTQSAAAQSTVSQSTAAQSMFASQSRKTSPKQAEQRNAVDMSLSEKYLNGTERAIRDRDVFQGPTNIETNYQRYNGLFQPN